LREPKVPFFVPWITESDRRAVADALSSRWLTGGPKIAEFERNFAEYIGVKHAVAVSSCTAALHLVMRALGIGHDDEVIVPTFTFAATVNSVLYCGAKPILCDVNPVSFNISPPELREKITKRTKGIIAVHYGGLACEMDRITEIADERGLFLVEDCAHSLGATYRGKQTGGLGRAGCFSFYPTKNITTMEGGMITTDDDKLAERTRLLRSQGLTNSPFSRQATSDWHYDIVELGYNYRLTEVQAALGVSQLSRIDQSNSQRNKAPSDYRTRMANVEGVVSPPAEQNHVYHLYSVRVVEDDYHLTRDQLLQYLSSKGIEPSFHFTPVHQFTYYKQTLVYMLGVFPVAEQLGREVLSLPLFPTITLEQIECVCDAIREANENAPKVV
jgi:dTDP-4-amino-4,6-dideoxygalactose transaminase